MNHSIDTLVQGILSREVIDAIAIGKPLYLPNLGLPPIVSKEEVIQLACRIAKGHRFRVVNDGDTIHQSGPKFNSEPTAVYIDELRNKATLHIGLLHDDFPGLNDLCVALYAILKKEIQLFAFLGHDGSTGAGLHFDFSDVIVLQQEGRKAWKVRGREPRSKPVLDVVVPPGGLIYLPAYDYHDPQTLPGEDSLHLSISFKPQRDARRLAGI